MIHSRSSNLCRITGVSSVKCGVNTLTTQQIQLLHSKNRGGQNEQPLTALGDGLKRGNSLSLTRLKPTPSSEFMLDLKPAIIRGINHNI